MGVIPVGAIPVIVILVGRNSGGRFSLGAVPGGRNHRWTLFRIPHNYSIVIEKCDINYKQRQTNLNRHR
jgi:hypothetical protein